MDESSLLYVSDGSGDKFVNLLRGNESIGALLQSEGYEAVPSPANPNPEDKEYFAAYKSPITNLYREWNGTNGPDVIQFEIPSTIRFDATKRKQFAETLAEVIVGFYNKYYSTLFFTYFNIY